MLHFSGVGDASIWLWSTIQNTMSEIREISIVKMGLLNWIMYFN